MMKKFIFTCLQLPFCLLASPVGNTFAPATIQKGIFFPQSRWVDLRVGYEGDFVTDARLQQYNEGNGRVDSFEQNTNSFSCTLNFGNRMDVYGVFGSSNVETDWRYADEILETINRVKIKTENSFLWAVGARAVLFEWRRLSLGTGGRYSSSHYNPEWVSSNGFEVPATHATFDWHEWQVNLDMSYKISFLVPYVGVKYSNAKSLLNNFPLPISSDLTGSNSLKTRGPVGFYLGVSLSSGNYFFLNLEGRLIDEEAISIFADFRF